MGSKLASQNSTFQLLMQARRDPHPSAKGLEKLQVIKGWLDAEGNKRAEIIDVAAKESSNSDGDVELCAVYTDPDYDPSLPTYYYLRAVEAESQRWSSLQCQALAENSRPENCVNPMPATINELAWTSPIWLAASNR